MTPRPRLLAESNTRTRYSLSPDDETCVPQTQLDYLAHARVQGYAWRVHRQARGVRPMFDRDTVDHLIFRILILTARPAP